MSQYKTCTKCSQTKELTDFSKRKLSVDNLAATCKACAAKYATDYCLANRESLAASAKKYQKINAESIAEKKKAYRELNKDKIAAYFRIYRKTNPEVVALISKRYKSANKDLATLLTNKRRARKLNNGVFFISKKELDRLYASPCAYCSAPSKHLDHIIPLSREGTHGIGNLTGSCASCNLSKGSKFITEWKKGKQ